MRRLAIGLVGLGVGVVAVAGRASATPAPVAVAATTATVDVFQASGLLDHVLVDHIRQAVDAAAASGAQALIIQLNSKGAIVGRREVAALADHLLASKVPVAIWVGPSGARAAGASGQLLFAAAATGMAPASRVGQFGGPLTLSSGAVDFGAASALVDRTVGATDAHDKYGLIRNTLNDATVPTLRSMVLALDGVDWHGTTIHTAERTVASDGTARTELTAPVRLAKLGLLAQLFHTVSSPPVAYLLTVIGLCLLVFEFFTAGVGVAGVVGAIAVVLGSFGIAALPLRGWAYVLLVVSILAFAIDVQTGVPRTWTAIGVVLFVVASLLLYRGLHLSWIALLTGIGGVLLAFLTGMPSMVRTRFATPTIGRDWMIGSFGEAVTWVDPQGIVQVGDGKWRARTNRATPITAGDRVRVVAIDGITLEVEPETGAARDYRERRESRA